MALLDFGLARILGHKRMTRTGIVLGTPEYMSPEQARGNHADVGPSTDIFSLGCILYECLTGQPAFAGEHIAAVLAKVLFQAVRPLRLSYPQIPTRIDSLVGRMLAKDPRERPRDATALLAELVDLGELSQGDSQLRPAAAFSPNMDGLADSEQTLFSVVIAAPPSAPDEIDNPAAESPQNEEQNPRAMLRRALSRLGAHSELLADGSLVAAISQTSSATDQVAQAARCALIVHSHWPDARVALGTGRGVLNRRIPVGEVIDRAVGLVRTPRESTADVPAVAGDPSLLDGVFLDDVSAGLLDPRFIILRTLAGPVLQAERVAGDDSRPLLGKPTPCVGREHELRILEAALATAIEEGGARAVLVTGPPGYGKSRVRHEFLRRLSATGREQLVLFGRGEPMRDGSPYSLISQALRRLCNLNAGDSPATQREKLRARLTQYVAATDAQRVSEFLGEVCQLPFPDNASVKLRAARNDPKIMRDQIGWAFVDWLRAECKHCPVLLILEDMHWGDPLSARLIEISLRDLHDQPLLVLGLARPDISQLFPNLWADQRVQEIRLAPLSRKVSEQLVYEVLGRQIPRETALRIVEQSQGNALFLEELIRAHAEGKGDSPPETVLALLLSRLARLDPGQRRLLRGASIFGAIFWEGGVRALYGLGQRNGEFEECLARLKAAEIITVHEESRLPGETEYSFRHILMRDAAYSMLTEEDRSLGHRLAAGFLEQAGESDAMVLAEHLRCGGLLERAIPYYLRAAEQSYRAYDSQGTLARSAKGVECGAQSLELGTLRALQSLAHFWRAEWAAALPLGLEVLALVPAGDYWWCETLSVLVAITANINQPEKLQELVRLFAENKPASSARGPYVAVASNLVIMYSLLGDREQAQSFLERMLDAGAEFFAQDRAALGFLNFSRCAYARLWLAEPWLAHQLAQVSVAAFQQADDLRNLVIPQAQLGLAQAELGDAETGEKTLRQSLALAERLGEPVLIANSKLYLASLLAEVSEPTKLEEAHSLTMFLINLGLSPGYTGYARVIQSTILYEQGRYAEAEVQAREGLGPLAMMGPYQVTAYTSLCRALLALGRAAEATTIGEEGLALFLKLKGPNYHEIRLRLAVAESRHALGDEAAAREAMKEVMRQIHLRADQNSDEAQRARYWTAVPLHARARELACLWLGTDS